MAASIHTEKFIIDNGKLKFNQTLHFCSDSRRCSFCYIGLMLMKIKPGIWLCGLQNHNTV